MAANVLATAVFGVTFAAAVALAYRMRWLRSPLGPFVIVGAMSAATLAGASTLVALLHGAQS